jgi:Tat protein secretion system quality control protein TatD with DNase activity
MSDLELFDTHCHIHEMVRRTTPVYDKWHSDDVTRTPESVITAANQAGVNRMLCIGTTLTDRQRASG